jgi:hypothetical protein
MAPVDDLVELADAAERLAAWAPKQDSARLLELACDLRRRAEGRQRRWFWILPRKTPPRRALDIRRDEAWDDPELVRFTVATDTGDVALEASKNIAQKFAAVMLRVSEGEGADAILLEPRHWQVLSGEDDLALRVELLDGGAICLPLTRSVAARLLSWLNVTLGASRLRQPVHPVRSERPNLALVDLPPDD